VPCDVARYSEQIANVPMIHPWPHASAAANHLRHAKFIGLRDDRDAKEIVREAFEVES
jgi:hypothetical protein